MKRIVFTILIFAFITVPVKADYTYYFQQITNNPTDYSPDTIAKQLSVVVADEGSSQVSFTFYNNVGIQSTIAGIFFDDSAGVLSGLTTLDITDSGSGVSFSSDLKNFPGGNTIIPLFDTTDSAIADPPPSINGINTSTEWAKLTFTYTTTFADVINQINAGWMGPSDTLRIGLHVTSIPNGEGTNSNSFILVPLPATFLLGLLGLGVGGLKLRKRTLFV